MKIEVRLVGMLQGVLEHPLPEFVECSFRQGQFPQGEDADSVVDLVVV